MIKTYLGLMDELSSYASPKARLTRLLKAGRLIRLRRGLYTDDAATPRLALAPLIYGPSYVSFQTALAAAGLIPERVEAVMSAAFHKNKDKVFHTPLGEYHYLYLPDAVYPYGVRLVETAAVPAAAPAAGDGAAWLMATPEKALCDALYKAPPLTRTADVEALLWDDWRLDRRAFDSLDRDFLLWIAPRYRRATLGSFARWLREVAS